MTATIVHRHTQFLILALGIATPAFAQLAIVGEATHDLGTFPATETKTAEFSIRNNGQVPVTVTAARASCGACTTATYPKTAIPPGGAATITITTKAGQLLGKFERFVLMNVTPEQPPLRLVIIGHATPGLPSFQFSKEASSRTAASAHKNKAPLVAVNAPHRDLGAFPATESKRAEFTIRNAGQAPAKIINARVSGDACTVTAYPKEPIPPGGEGAITVVTTPGQLSGKFYRSAFLYTATDQSPLCLTLSGEAVSAQGTVPPDKRLPEAKPAAGRPVSTAPRGPAQLAIVGEPTRDLGTFPAAETRSTEFSLRNTGKTPIKITAARAGCGSCTSSTFSAEPIPPGGEGMVTIATKPGRLSGKFERFVFLNTQPDQMPLRLTVTGVAVPAKPGGAPGKTSPAPQAPAQARLTEPVPGVVPTPAPKITSTSTASAPNRQPLNRTLAIDLNHDGIISPREAKLFQEKPQAAVQAKTPPSTTK